MLRSKITELQFALRKNYLGKMVLRQGLPQLRSSEELKKERQFYRLLLSRGFAFHEKKYDHVIDIGCRNGSYLQALSESFPGSKVTGIEVDGGRRYWNLYCRRDFARSHVAELNQKGIPVCFWEGDFLDFKEVSPSQRVIFCFFYPFVSENPCLKWGLPLRFSNFLNLIGHVKELTDRFNLQATVFSAHQGEWEAEEARCSYADHEISFSETRVSVEDLQYLWPSDHSTHLFHCELVKRY